MVDACLESILAATWLGLGGVVPGFTSKLPRNDDNVVNSSSLVHVSGCFFVFVPLGKSLLGFEPRIFRVRTGCSVLVELQARGWNPGRDLNPLEKALQANALSIQPPGMGLMRSTGIEPMFSGLESDGLPLS